MKTKISIKAQHYFLLLFVGSLCLSFATAGEKPNYGYGWFPVVAVGEGGAHWTECIETIPEDYCVPTEFPGEGGDL